jgi:uncharacterized protein YchJ
MRRATPPTPPAGGLRPGHPRSGQPRRGGPGGAATWAREAQWHGLEIVATEAGGPDDETGTVEFIARYSAKGAPVAHHERSTFKKIDGRWFYMDGDMVKPRPVVRDAPRVGRNDPCPCGSGKVQEVPRRRGRLSG